MICFLFIENFVKLKISWFYVKIKNSRWKHEVKRNIFSLENCLKNIKVMKRTKLNAPLQSEYDDEMMLTIIVYR